MSKSNESKTVKEALKEARENIDKKDFKTALKCCKRALNVDKTNYMALVYCGLCLAEVDQPEQALKVRRIISLPVLFHIILNFLYMEKVRMNFF